MPPKVSSLDLETDLDLTDSTQRGLAVEKLAEQLAAQIEAMIVGGGASGFSVPERRSRLGATVVIKRIRQDQVRPENAKLILDYIQKFDAPIGSVDPEASYRVRQWCLWKDKGNPKNQTQSWQAYTNLDRHTSDSERDRALGASGWMNWHPKRRPVIEQATGFAQGGAERMADRMGQKPILLVMRGNTASGKTTALKSIEKLSKQLPVLAQLNVLDEKGKADDAFNPDTVKGWLRRNAEDMNATHGQVHEEGSTITNVLVEDFLKTGRSHVMDKRYGTAKQVTKVVEAARGTPVEGHDDGYTIFMIDVDADLGTSCPRVLKRSATGDDPLVNFHAVEEGYLQVRSNRDQVARLADVDAYFLLRSGTSNDDPANGKLVASRISPRLGGNGELDVFDDRLYALATAVDDEDVELAKKHFMDVMNTRSSKPGDVTDDHVKTAVSGYLKDRGTA
jgi:hypothetical protein